ncbi:MAG: hypothetical protein IMW89_17575 [Ktedonobacteraceae bacterium]|nr:hypothetical protein [Ktedonobacteraceae bacterium]
MVSFIIFMLVIFSFSFVAVAVHMSIRPRHSHRSVRLVKRISDSSHNARLHSVLFSHDGLPDDERYTQATRVADELPTFA